MRKTETQRNTWYPFRWMFTFLTILILTFFLIGTKAIAEGIDVDVDTQTGVNLDNRINLQGGEIPRQYPEMPPYPYASAPAAPVRLDPSGFWNEDDIWPIFGRRDTWTMEEMNTIVDPNLNPEKLFREFYLWVEGLEPKERIKIILPYEDKKTQEIRYPLLPKYQDMGYAIPSGYHTAFKSCITAAKIYAEKGADAILIEAVGTEKEQHAWASNLGFGSIGNVLSGTSGGGGAFGYVRHKEWIKYKANRFVRICPIRYLETEEEWKARLAREKAEKAAREVPLVKEKVPLVEAKKVAETKVMPPPVVVYFPYDSAEILPKEHYKLMEIADWLAKHPEYQIQIEGHACPIGSEDYNAVLARKRALAGAMGIVDILEKPPYNIPINQIMPDLIVQYVSVGEDKLVVQSTTIEGGKPNRRFEIRIVGPSSGEVARGG